MSWFWWKFSSEESFVWHDRNMCRVFYLILPSTEQIIFTNKASGAGVITDYIQTNSLHLYKLFNLLLILLSFYTHYLRTIYEILLL